LHELSLCGAVAETVRRHAGDRRVRRVRLRIGHFRQVVPETLAWCWEMQSRGGPLEGSELDVVDVPTVVRCRSCAAETTLAAPILLCDACDGADVELLSGEELDIESIEVVVADALAVPDPAAADS
jgi:hydrogenase nickel incorporation protein HypA/HybF